VPKPPPASALLPGKELEIPKTKNAAGLSTGGVGTD
jgi:hypothetical protein